MVKGGFISRLESIAVNSESSEVTVLQSPKEKENIAVWKIREALYLILFSLICVYVLFREKSSKLVLVASD